MTTNPLLLNNVDVRLDLKTGVLDLLIPKGSPAALAIGEALALGPIEDNALLLWNEVVVKFYESIAPTKADIESLPLLQASTELAPPTLTSNTVHIVDGVASYHGTASLSGGGCGYCENNELHLGSRTLSQVVAFLQDCGSIHLTEPFKVTIAIEAIAKDKEHDR